MKNKQSTETTASPQNVDCLRCAQAIMAKLLRGKDEQEDEQVTATCVMVNALAQIAIAERLDVLIDTLRIDPNG